MILEVKEDADTGELYIEFPDDVMEQLDWKPGDVIQWSENEDNSWSLTKVENDNTRDD